MFPTGIFAKVMVGVVCMYVDGVVIGYEFITTHQWLIQGWGGGGGGKTLKFLPLRMYICRMRMKRKK